MVGWYRLPAVGADLCIFSKRIQDVLHVALLEYESDYEEYYEPREPPTFRQSVHVQYYYLLETSTAKRLTTKEHVCLRQSSNGK